MDITQEKGIVFPLSLVMPKLHMFNGMKMNLMEL